MTGEGRGRGMFQWVSGRCGAYRKHPMLAPHVCGAPPTWVGLQYYESPRPVVVRGYACDEHRSDLDVSRTITPADAPERQRRLDGKPPEPLAYGREARELIRAAYRWAACRDAAARLIDRDDTYRTADERGPGPDSSGPGPRRGPR